MLGGIETIAAAVLGILGLIGAIFLRRSGRKDAEQKAKEADYERAKDTRDRLSKVRDFDDPDAAREWLRRNGWDRGDDA